MPEFINLSQGGMSLTEYSLMFTQLSKYAPTMVAGSVTKINKYVIWISYLVVNECRSFMLIPSMEITCHMVHAEQFGEKKLMKVGRELNRTRDEDGNSSKT